MARRITYVTDGWNALLTNCPFGMTVKGNNFVVKVGSIYCVNKCRFHGAHCTDYDVECNHPKEVEHL